MNSGNLKTAVEGDRDWRQASLSEVIDHILRAHHEWLKENMPRISRLASEVARAHGGHAPQVGAIDEVYGALREEMEPHLAKEEIVLFPAALGWAEAGVLSLGCHAAENLDGPLSVMESDHKIVGELLERLVALTERFQPPAMAGATWRALYDALRELDANTRAHIRLENEVLHPAIRRLAEA